MTRWRHPTRRAMMHHRRRRTTGSSWSHTLMELMHRYNRLAVPHDWGRRATRRASMRRMLHPGRRRTPHHVWRRPSLHWAGRPASHRWARPSSHVMHTWRRARRRAHTRGDLHDVDGRHSGRRVWWLVMRRRWPLVKVRRWLVVGRRHLVVWRHHMVGQRRLVKRRAAGHDVVLLRRDKLYGLHARREARFDQSLSSADGQLGIGGARRHLQHLCRKVLGVIGQLAIWGKVGDLVRSRRLRGGLPIIPEWPCHLLFRTALAKSGFERFQVFGWIAARPCDVAGWCGVWHKDGRVGGEGFAR